MTLPRILALMIALFAAAPLLAQPRAGGGTIVGVVVGQDGEGLPGGTVAVWSAADSSLVTGGVGNSEGAFTIEGVRPGRYYLKISSLGHLPARVDAVTVAPGGGRVDVGSIRLQPDTSVGDGVTVTGTRSDIEFRADRTIYNVENQPVTAGGDGVDVLKNVPQVEVDIDDNISLRGSQNVVVLVNGRAVPLNGEALARYLRTLSAERIKSIEVIPNPSAKYDPDGMAGIINIVMKENTQEDNVSGNITVGAATNTGANASGSLTIGTGPWRILGGYGFRYNDRESGGELYRVNRVAEPETILDQTSSQQSIRRSHAANASVDYTLGERSSLYLTSLFSVGEDDEIERITYVDRNAAGEMLAETLRTGPEEDRWKSADLALGYRWIKEASRHELSAEARVTIDDENETARLAERLVSSGDSLIDTEQTRGSERTTEASAQIDYLQPVGANGRLEVGYKGELQTLDEEYYSESLDFFSGEFRPDVDRNNSFIYDRMTHSLYGLYAHTFGKLDAQAGLRLEQAITDFDLVTTGETFDNDYTSLFPSAAISYTFTQATRVRASYSRRVHRPRVGQLNPFPQYEDPLNLRTGNPALLPEYITSVELGINQFLPFGTVSLTPYFRQTSDKIERTLTLDSSGVSRMTFANFNESESYGAELVTTFRLKDRLTGFLNLSGYRIITDADNVESSLSNDAFGWSGRANASVKITDALGVQASYNYRAPVRIGGGQIDASHSADLAAKLTILDEKGAISLRVSDLFNTGGFTLRRDDVDYSIATSHRWQSRVGWLTFSYDFGTTEKERARRAMNRPEGEDRGNVPTGIDF